MTYLIEVEGCDDSTWLVVNLAERAMVTLRWFATKVNATSTCNCQPTINITAAVDVDAEMLKKIPDRCVKQLEAAKEAMA